MPHLLVAITAHGYGHVAQTAPVVNALRRHLPTLRLTLYSSLPRRFLASRFHGEFAHLARAPDVGMRMKDALEVDTSSSDLAYERYHRHWRRGIAAEARMLTDRGVDAVLANVPYRLLAAAAEAGIPAVALCNLNWQVIYSHFCGTRPEAATVLATMGESYRNAYRFLQPMPAMPMPDLDNRLAIGPIAQIGIDYRAQLRARLGLPPTARLVLISLGGVPTEIDLADWPELPDLYWIVPQRWQPRRRDAVTLESLNMAFVDILRSADALITKPGYGSFVEAACNGVPVLYTPRLDWPEEPFLVEWLQKHGRCLHIERSQLQHGELAMPLERLLALPSRSPVIPSGITDAVTCLTKLLNPA